MHCTRSRTAHRCGTCVYTCIQVYITNTFIQDCASASAGELCYDFGTLNIIPDKRLKYSREFLRYVRVLLKYLTKNMGEGVDPTQLNPSLSLAPTHTRMTHKHGFAKRCGRRENKKNAGKKCSNFNFALRPLFGSGCIAKKENIDLRFTAVLGRGMTQDDRTRH